MKKEAEKLILLPVTAGLACPSDSPWEKAGFISREPVNPEQAAECLAKEDIRTVVLFGGRGESLCRRLSHKENMALMLVAEREQYDDLRRTLAPEGVLVLPEDAPKNWLEQGFFLLAAMNRRLQGLAARADDLQMKMDDMRLIERAKLLLVERLNMSEQQAHRYIEKRAMDRCVKRRVVAQEIIRIYES